MLMTISSLTGSTKFKKILIRLSYFDDYTQCFVVDSVTSDILQLSLLKQKTKQLLPATFLFTQKKRFLFKKKKNFGLKSSRRHF